MPGQFEARTTIDLRGQIALPGLINTHTHAPMVLYRGLADDLALMDWLQKYIFPAEKATVSPDFVRVGTRLAALEMIQSGTTTFADMYYFEDDIADATRDAGLRAVLGQSVIMFPVADAPTPKDGLARAEAFITKWKNDALITPAVAPHAPYTLDGPTLQAARALANAHGVPLLIHLAETQEEIKIVNDAHKQSPTQYLDGLGIWNGRSLAAHAVWLDDRDMATLATRGVGLAHNPESNMKLASGVADVPAWIERGIRAGLGTDGAASNNDLDMFEAMRMAALLQKVTRRRSAGAAGPSGARTGDSSWRRGARPRRSHRQSGAGQTGRHHHGGPRGRARHADVRSDFPSRLCRPRQRRPQYDRCRPRPDAGRPGDLDAEKRRLARCARDGRAGAAGSRPAGDPGSAGREVAIMEILIPQQELEQRITDLAQEIRRDYGPDRPVHFIAVLKGAFVFLADLVRRMDGPNSLDFIAVSSYGSGTTTSGEVRLLKDLDRSVEGRDVIIVEDIVDTGLTLSYLQEILLARNPKSLKTACLLSKPSRRKVDVKVEYIGFTIEDRFVVGYGLDYNERYRNLPYIGLLDGAN